MGEETELRARLRAAAAEHRPDRARMLARVTSATGAAEERAGGRERDRMPRPARRAFPAWARAAGAAAGLVGALGAGGVAVWAAQGGEPPQTVRTSPKPAAPPETPSKEPRGAQSAPERVADGPLWSDGSVDPGSNTYWAQSNVTVKTTERLSSLVVELRVARTGDVSATGSWRTRPAKDFEVTVRVQGDALVYRWVLKPGRTVPAGEHVFAGQYDHARGERDAGRDRYSVAARGPSGELSVRGDFF
ncbi:hypothetical protein [Streptomyces daliensis]|uniref:Uncharacterized protein n=1 Tax=Streptomyces daliensis TaxID=299421 RepID=A0A8T4IVA7_9ACTN|nr:hypothetical protein [Streptomyces daliensis]